MLEQLKPSVIKKMSENLVSSLKLRPRLIKKVSRKAGLSPGTLVHIGKKGVEKVKITIIDYNEKQFEEKEAKKVEECFPFKQKSTITWINIDGLHDVEVIAKIGKHFDLHPLIQEDILNTGQRPKMEDSGNYIYVVLKVLSYNEKEEKVMVEQVSLILGSNFVISFQEMIGDIFDPIRQRIKNGKGRHRKMGPDYLAYSLIDAVVDNYFVILEKFGERIEGMEDELVTNPKPETLQAIHTLKREMIILRKAVWPLREVISGLERVESKLIKKMTGIYFRDVYDHTIQVIDTVETYRDLLSGMLDLYLSSISNRMNEVMKVLTIIATIFIPLTFIVGVYGMNFQFMPELQWHWGYPIVWLVMLTIAVFMLYFFKNKRWL